MTEAAVIEHDHVCAFALARKFRGFALCNCGRAERQAITDLEARLVLADALAELVALDHEHCPNSCQTGVALRAYRKESAPRGEG